VVVLGLVHCMQFDLVRGDIVRVDVVLPSEDSAAVGVLSLASLVFILYWWLHTLRLSERSL